MAESDSAPLEYLSLERSGQTRQKEEEHDETTELRVALGRIADGQSDPQFIAEEALDDWHSKPSKDEA